MTFKKTLQAAVAALAFGAAGFASAAVTTLTFEGVGDVNPIGSYYNGGAGGDLGIEFSASSLALVDSDAGGQGDFANEPGPGSTVMFFLDADSAYLNYAAGFTGGFAFYYSSEVATIVEVWDGLNGGGNRIGFITLDAQFQAQSLTNPDGCSGDPNGKYCNWTLAGLAFTETARSVSFTGAANMVGFDNMSFGKDDTGCTVNCNPVPEPATLALVGAALLGLSASRRRKV